MMGNHISRPWNAIAIFAKNGFRLVLSNPTLSSWWLFTYIYIFIYIYVYFGLVFRVPTPPWYGSPGSTPFPSICKLLAAFLRSSLVFARSLQHFWLSASQLLGTCYLLDDLRSTHTPSKYLRATYSHIYICNVCTFYLLPVYSHNTTCV